MNKSNRCQRQTSTPITHFRKIFSL
uniref:Uncharacterized protein n=1 Tax=Anguilla anguilla TaxID=7936 RepID=A0A0E9WGK5_ANGAN